ncbi:hypothetical protein THAOC_27823, partial [Thalassiosira oceanica]
MKIEVPDRHYQVAHSKAPGLGITERPPNGPGSSFLESSRRALQVTPDRRIQGLPSFGERSSPGDSAAALDDSRKALVGREMKKKSRHGDCQYCQSTWPVAAVTSRRGRSREEENTRGVLLRRQERAYDGLHPPAGGGAPSTKTERRPGDRVVRPSVRPSEPGGALVPPAPASGGRSRSPSGLALRLKLRAGPSSSWTSPSPPQRGVRASRGTDAAALPLALESTAPVDRL